MAAEKSAEVKAVAQRSFQVRSQCQAKDPRYVMRVKSRWKLIISNCHENASIN